MKRLVTTSLPLLLVAAACTTVPNPRKTPVPKPTIDAKYAELCIDIGTFVRRPDFWCEPTSQGHVAGHRWAYPINNESWATYELPAVGEPLAAGWGFPIKPTDVAPVRIPEEGAVFKK